jgi:nicotinamidase-related amidase
LPPACSISGGAAALIVIDMQPAFAALGGNSQRPENKLKMEKLIAEQKEKLEELGKSGEVDRAVLNKVIKAAYGLEV